MIGDFFWIVFGGSRKMHTFTLSSHAGSVDYISNRSPSLFVDIKQFRSNAFRVQFGLTLLNANFFQDCEFVHELLLLSPCDLHDDWIQPLAGHVVTDVLVFFSSPLKKNSS